MRTSCLWTSIFSVLQIEQQLFNLHNLARMNQFTFINDLFGECFHIRVLVQVFHVNTTNTQQAFLPIYMPYEAYTDDDSLNLDASTCVTVDTISCIHSNCDTTHSTSAQMMIVMDVCSFKPKWCRASTFPGAIRPSILTRSVNEYQIESRDEAVSC